MIITRLNNPLKCMRLCWLIRIGKFRSTPRVRQEAKIATFHIAYGGNTGWLDSSSHD